MTYQAAETKEKLLKSAGTLFSQKGYKATSIREINRSVDMADGLLYHYFPGGKKEIFLKVYEDSMAKTLKSFRETAKRTVPVSHAKRTVPVSRVFCFNLPGSAV